ncbi:MAG: hypothetical protein AB7O67_16650 [Vicinamibacterales bacterium]
MDDVFAFECSVAGWGDSGSVVNARSAGRAKSTYLSDLRDSYPEIPYTLIRCRKLGAPRSSDEFLRTAEYRGMPGLRCGARVRVGEASGVVVGHNSSANFDVLFDDDAPRHAGLTLNVHPSEIVVARPSRAEE